MTWYKKRISQLIYSKKNEVPYRYWSGDLFANSEELNIPDKLDQVLNNVAVVIGSWERVVSTARIWSDEKTLNFVNHGYILTMMFFCLQYPREAILLSLKESLPDGSGERELCASLVDMDGDYRHIRNSIAHSSFEVTNDGKSIDFTDRNWIKRKSLAEVELDSLIIFDVLMSAFAAKMARVAEQGAALEVDPAAFHPRQ